VNPGLALNVLTDALATLLGDPAPGTPGQAIGVIDEALHRLHALRDQAVTETHRRHDEAMRRSGELLDRINARATR
jgi:hypothetical protein